MYEINDRTQLPYSAVCYIRCDWADGTSTRASAVVIGYNDVLTALHAVFDTTRGGWAQSITIVPGADTYPYFVSPYGSFNDVGSVEGRAANWDFDGDGLLSQEESQGDLALIGTRSRIGDVTGWLPVAQVPNDFNGVMVGYPARGTGMMAENVFADAQSSATVYDVQASLGAGASGGPLLYNDGSNTYVTGVLSGGSTTASTYAGLFGAETWAWLQSRMAANDSLLGYAPGTATTSGTFFNGTGGADHFTGGAGRDTFYGHAGNDTLEGGGDIDLAMYDGPRADYQVTVLADGLNVRDTFDFRDGMDSLHTIERLKFSDVYVAFDVTGNGGEAYRLYQAAFNRAPDVPGLGYHINDLDRGVGIGTVAAHFVESPEFTSTYGPLSNEQFVRQLYLNVLHRQGEESGVAYHLEHLDSGALQRWDVLAQFSESPENQANVIGTIQNGMVYTL